MSLINTFVNEVPPIEPIMLIPVSSLATMTLHFVNVNGKLQASVANCGIA